MSHMDWRPPQCIHGNIILGCPHDDCSAQNAYLDQANAAMREMDHRGQQAARDIVRPMLGLPLDKYVCPQCGPDELTYCWCGSKLAYRNDAYVGFWCPAHGPQERVYGPTPAPPTIPHG